ncbi:MAG: hypothetical protein K2G37_01540 [Clostridia bacterium]|nr:hypothetical protein [Clostridia bacterium]MDE7328632.1 hypothetical protein [Clostridia bacterium]
MTAFLTLTKRIIKNTLVPNFSDAKEKKKYIGIIVAVAICLGIPYLGVLISAYELIATSLELGYLTEVLSVLFLATQLITIFLSLFVYINIMYYSKDNEFLFTLPLKSVSVFWAKLIAIVVHELIISAIMIIPMSIVVGIALAKSAIGLNAGFLLLIIPATVLLPLMAILLIALVSYPLMKILNFFKKRPILGAVFVIILVAAFYIAIYVPMLISAQQSPSAGDIEGSIDESGGMNTSQVFAQVLPSLTKLGRYSFHTYFLAKAMTATNGAVGFGYAMAFIGIVIGLAAIGSLLSVWQYSKLATASLESGGGSKSAGKVKEAKSRNYKKALYLKDISSVVKNNSLLIQSGLMTILPPILIFFVCQMQSGIQEVGAVVGVGIAELILKIMLSSNVASILAFSRDGEGVIKYKTLPVNVKDVVNAKIKTGLTFSLIATAFSTVALAFVPGMNIVFVIGFLASNAVYALAINRFSVYRDLKKPNIHWKNITEITKNNFSSFIPMLISFVPGLIVMVGTIAVGISLDINQYVLGLLYCAIALAVGGLFLLIVKALTSFDEEEALERVE